MKKQKSIKITLDCRLRKKIDNKKLFVFLEKMENYLNLDNKINKKNTKSINGKIKI